ncbi:MAG: glutamine-hydrolyzing carbamoyl-phosphate synthase small subunit [Bacteroidota bacterium]
MSETHETRRAVLLLEDGLRLEGRAIGAQATVAGELCFNTGMSGYQEIFTDPSYYGQVIVMTHTHIGTYGVMDIESESPRAQLTALVVKNFSDHFSRSGEVESLQQYLEDHHVPGISGVDTRMLVRHIREKGAMNAIVSTEGLSDDELQQSLAAHPSMKGLELASRVTTREVYTPEFARDGHKHVAVIDYGVKQNILRSLAQRGVKLTVFPSHTSAKDILKGDFDGIFLSNGPGDPGAMDTAVGEVKQLVDSGKPVFGICLGHQLIARAHDLPTYKLQFGHRGINHPVQNLERGRSEITSQNHGFAVDRDALEDHASLTLTHRHLNDDTVQGLRVNGKPVFCVQYHPESNPGPHDSRYLFDDFVAML